jgi:glycosyltransferase involved in cell wall biosynthesis
MNPQYSVVMPAYNEEQGLTGIIEQTVQVLQTTGCPYEIILIDDGSRDRTWEIIQRLKERHPEIRGLRFARNFGHQLAVHAGIKAAAGQVIAVMDSDGQDPPDLLPSMFEKIEKGHYDVVSCVRRKRKESALKRLFYFLFYRLYQKLVPFELPVDAGDFSAMNRNVVDIIAGISQHAPFIRGMRAWAGGRQCNIEYDRPARTAGQTKYSVVKLFILAVDGITSFSKAPLRLSIILGIVVSVASLLYAIYVIVAKVAFNYPSEPEKMGWASLAVLISFLGGMILTILGIIGEYLGHIFDAVRGVPPYHITDRL